VSIKRPKPNGRPHLLSPEFSDYGRHLWWCHIVNEPGLGKFPGGDKPGEYCGTCDQKIETDVEPHTDLHTFIGTVLKARSYEF
jgi:hypothetical protein